MGSHKSVVVFRKNIIIYLHLVLISPYVSIGKLNLIKIGTSIRSRFYISPRDLSKTGTRMEVLILNRLPFIEIKNKQQVSFDIFSYRISETRLCEFTTAE